MELHSYQHRRETREQLLAKNVHILNEPRRETSGLKNGRTKRVEEWTHKESRRMDGRSGVIKQENDFHEQLQVAEASAKRHASSLVNAIP